MKDADISEMFFTPYHVGRCCSNTIRGHSYTNIILDDCFATLSSNGGNSCIQSLRGSGLNIGASGPIVAQSANLDGSIRFFFGHSGV